MDSAWMKASVCCAEYGLLHPGLVLSVAKAIREAVDEAVKAERIA